MGDVDTPDPELPNGEERREADRRKAKRPPQSAIDEVHQLMTTAINQGKGIRERLDALDERHDTEETLLEKLLEILDRIKHVGYAVLALCILFAITFGFLGSIAKTNRENSKQARQAVRGIVECTTADPDKQTPKAKPIDKEDEVHECFNAGQTNQTGAVQSIVDSNQNRIPDFVEAHAYLVCLQKGIELDKCPLPAPTLPELKRR